MTPDLTDLRLDQQVEVLHATTPPGSDIPTGREWRPGRVVGLYHTSVHIRLDDDPDHVVAFSADMRDKTWRAVGRTYVIPALGDRS